MSEPTPSTWRARLFGRELRKLRRGKGFKADDIAASIGRAHSTVIRAESGESPAKLHELEQILDMCGVTDRAIRAEYHQRAQEVLHKGWWNRHAKNPDFRDYLWAEDNAHQIRDFQLASIPELLHTQAYTEMLAKSGPLSHKYGSIANLREVHRSRTEVFWRKDPPQTKFVIPETVFNQRIPEVSTEIFREQFKHLRMLTQYEDVQIRVLPTESMIHNLLGVNASFTILDLKRWPAFVYFETPAGAVIAEETYTARHMKTFDRIWHEALDDEETDNYLVRIEKAMS